MGSQYHASIEVELSAISQMKDYSGEIVKAFTNDDNYSHCANRFNSDHYSLDFFGNGLCDGRVVKAFCSKLAKNPEVTEFTLTGTLSGEGSSARLDAVRARYHGGTMLFEYWYDCDPGNELNLDTLVPSIYESVRVDSTYCLEQYNIFIENKAAIHEIVVNSSSEEVPSGAFAAFHNLKKIDLPDNVKYIGPKAFVDCEKLTQVNMPRNLKVVYGNSIVNCPNLHFELPKDCLTIKPDGCFEYKGLLYELVAKLGKEQYDLDSLFEIMLSSSEIEKAVQKIVKEEGRPLKYGLYGTVATLSDYLAGLNGKEEIEKSLNSLFSSRTLEKMKTRYSIMVGLLKGMSPEDICSECGVSSSAVSSVSRILNQSLWTQVKWFYTYCLQKE